MGAVHGAANCQTQLNAGTTTIRQEVPSVAQRLGTPGLKVFNTLNYTEIFLSKLPINNIISVL